MASQVWQNSGITWCTYQTYINTYVRYACTVSYFRHCTLTRAAHRDNLPRVHTMRKRMRIGHPHVVCAACELVVDAQSFSPFLHFCVLHLSRGPPICTVCLSSIHSWLKMSTVNKTVLCRGRSLYYTPIHSWPKMSTLISVNKTVLCRGRSLLLQVLIQMLSERTYLTCLRAQARSM